MKLRPTAILFDLDGTLLDTAPDILIALNQIRSEFNLSAVTLDELRPIISHGSKPMLKYLVGIDETHADFNDVREHFLKTYEKNLLVHTKFYPDIEIILKHLEDNNIRWGIVTNRLTRQALPLLKRMQLDQRTGCIVCGDTLPTSKPHPAPILAGCKELNCSPAQAVYIGDAITDMAAGKAAGTRTLAALYGYIGDHEDPYAWEADGYLKEPMDLMKWL